jgi:hypothetical protein
MTFLSRDLIVSIETPSDKAVFLLCEWTAGALIFGFIEGLATDRSVVTQGIYAILAVVFAVVGVTWPTLKLKVRPRFASSVERVANSRLYRRLIYAVLAIALFLSVSTRTYHYYHGKLNAKRQLQSAPPPGASSDTSDTSQDAVTVTDENGSPLKGAEIYFFRRNGVHSSKAISDDTGVAEVATLNEVVSVFCALDGFSSYYQKDYNPGTSLKIRLKKSPSGGSVIFADGTGYIGGLSGRLNPILDTLGRMYLYAENIAVDGGKAQPVAFVLNSPMTLEDLDGHRAEIKNCFDHRFIFVDRLSKA